jgi:hypothetical protein
MSRHWMQVASVAVLAAGCAATTGTTSDASPGTGLEGTVRIGPITPTCSVNVPCDAPFSAEFEVRSGGSVAGRFHSDSAGRFLILLDPGEYTVVPDSSAHLFPGIDQTRDVTVGAVGRTHLQLLLDTGIR